MREEAKVDEEVGSDIEKAKRKKEISKTKPNSILANVAFTSSSRYVFSFLSMFIDDIDLPEKFLIFLLVLFLLLILLVTHPHVSLTCTKFRSVFLFSGK